MNLHDSFTFITYIYFTIITLYCQFFTAQSATNIPPIKNEELSLKKPKFDYVA